METPGPDDTGDNASAHRADAHLHQRALRRRLGNAQKGVRRALVRMELLPQQATVGQLLTGEPGISTNGQTRQKI